MVVRGIDLVGMAVAVYNESTPIGAGFGRHWQQPLTRGDVIGHPDIIIDEEKGRLDMDYVNGRRCKCFVYQWYFQHTRYNEVHGPGSAERLVSKLGKR